MGKTKVLLDSNIFISALGWKGKPRVIFEKCLHGELDALDANDRDFIDLVGRILDIDDEKLKDLPYAPKKVTII